MSSRSVDIAPDGRMTNSPPAKADTVMHENRIREMWFLAAALLLAVVIHSPTFATMVEIWMRSDTFVHGFLIVPVSAYLVWRRWPLLRTVDIEPFYPGLLLLCAATTAWWLADFLDVQVGKQLMATAILPLLVLTLAGTKFTRNIAFPLGYLLFAVPFGEAAIPYLIDFTAEFTVRALQLTGFPVLRDGAFFSIPTGNFEVAKACSGIRYVLASLALGTLYGYLIYNQTSKRIAFFVFALVLPILANGVRAYGIVLLAHYSGMRIAVGVDHIIFGWLFFGLIMLLMFWVGNRYCDRPLAESSDELKPVTRAEGSASAYRRFLPAAGCVFLILVAGASTSWLLEGVSASVGAPGLPTGSTVWRQGNTTPDWQPAYVGASWTLVGQYDDDGRRIDLAIVRYDRQSQDAELANVMNAVADPKQWDIIRSASLNIDPGDGSLLPIRESYIRNDLDTRLVWSWHEVNGRPVEGDFSIKWHEFLSLMNFRLPVSAAILVSTDAATVDSGSREILTAYLSSSIAAIRQCLYAAEFGNSTCTTQIADAGPNKNVNKSK